MIPFSGITVMQCYVFTALWSCVRILISWHCSPIIFIYELRGWREICHAKIWSSPLTFYCESIAAHTQWNNSAVTEEANPMDLKSRGTLSVIFWWTAKERSIICRKVKYEAGLLCAMQTKAKWKKKYHLFLFINWSVCRHLLT